MADTSPNPHSSAITFSVLLSLAVMAAGLANPAIFPPAFLSFTSIAKWIVLLVPVALAIFLAGGVSRQLVAHTAGRIFVGLLVWMLFVLLVRGGESEQYLRWVSILLLFLVGYGAVPALLRGSTDPAHLARPLVYFAAALVASSVVAIPLFRGLAFERGRLIALFFNANLFGCALVMAVVVLAWYSWATTQFWKRSVLRILAGLAFLLLVFSGARGPLLSVIIGGVIAWAGMNRGQWLRKAPLLATCALLLAGLAFYSLGAADVDPAEGLMRERGGEEFRMTLFENSMDLIRREPTLLVTGLGIGMVRMTYFAGIGLADQNLSTIEYSYAFPKHLHNSYLEMLVETGLVGLVLTLALVYFALRSIWTLARHSRGREAVLHYGFLAIAIAHILQSALESILIAPGGLAAVWFWLLAGVYAGWSHSPAPESVRIVRRSRAVPPEYVPGNVIRNPFLMRSNSASSPPDRDRA